MPGYADQVIMAAGAFVQGSSIEMSADGPLRPPYTAFFQGGLTYESGKLGILAAADAMLPGRHLAGISTAIRKGTVWLLTGALALFTLYLTVSGAAAGSADTVTARLARGAVGVLPVVGSILADAADAVLAGAGAVRNTVGVAGLLAVLAVCLLPLVRLGTQYLVYKAAAFLAGVLGAERLTGLIDALGGAFGLIFGMTGACGLLLLISISSALGVVTG